jgi:glycosyltransferase involved in cell wall biosynthesis
VIEAAKRLPASDKILIALVGDGNDRERLMVMTCNLGVSDRVQFIDRQPMSRMPEMMATADTLLVHLRRSELSRYVIPSKTMAYLAAGRPILMAMEGAAADLVTEARAGMTVPPDDPEALAAAIHLFSRLPDADRKMYYECGPAFLRERFRKDVVVTQYESVLRNVAERSAH